MIQANIFNQNVMAYESWFEHYPEVYQSELAAIREHMSTLPERIRGIEVGLGTGRFAQPLGIKEGVEPADKMAMKAMKRGIEVINAVAENLPYKDLRFDFVLFVTICHFKDLKRAISEAYRILKNGGALIIGFLDKDQPIAKQYDEKRERSIFFKNATFYTVPRITKLLKAAHFSDLEYNQTLFGALDAIKTFQVPEKGFGKGSFIVVKAIKN